MTRTAVGLFLLTTLNCFSQSLHDDIKQTYDFSPGKLTREEQDKKIPLMDTFWNKVKSDTSKYLNELRSELMIGGNPKFFYFEGGQLLLSISKNLKDKEITLNAILKSDLADIDRRTMIGTLNYLAKANLNTTNAALTILDDKEFKFFLPEHSFYFNQGYCLTYALLPTSPNYYLTVVTNRFKEEKRADAKKSIVTLLWFANTCNGNEFLKQITTNKTLEKEVVKYTKDLLARKFEKEEYYKELDSLSFEELIKAQAAATNSMSDEAIYELDYITKLLRKSNCR